MEKAEATFTFEEVMQITLKLTPAQRVVLIQALVGSLKDFVSPDPLKPKKDPAGLWAQFNISVSDEDIAESRRAMFSHSSDEDAK